MERLRDNPDFLRQPEYHLGLFSDHGVVHARDVARQTLHVLENIHGVLIPRRPAQRLLFMQGYGVLLAYLHDIGMCDFSLAGRAMHPEFAGQAVFDPALEDVIQDAWHENGGNIAWRLSQLADIGGFSREPQIIFREILALSLCHSKSKVPVTALNDRSQLRRLAVEAISSNLTYLYHQQQCRHARQQLKAAGNDAPPYQAQRVNHAESALAAYLESQPLENGRDNPHLAPYYQDVAAEAFDWLLYPQPLMAELVLDIIDGLRILRSADALRQH